MVARDAPKQNPVQDSSVPVRPLAVRSRGEVYRVGPEPVWLLCPGFADELVGREAAQGLKAASVVVGVHEQLEVRPQLAVVVVVVAPDRGVPRLRGGRLLIVRFIRSTPDQVRGRL